ncbi:MAG: CPBP family intramembrane metalloprotease [Bacteroidales bacterium]|nr:CPBP family intramembrane metalloprotease [Bacteroidales bacterium]
MGNKQAWWKWLLLFIGGCILFLFSYAIILTPSGVEEEVSMPLWLLALLCVAASALNLLLYAGWWKWTEKRRAQDLPMRRLLSDTGIGFGIGILYFVIVTGVIALLGGYKVGEITPDWIALTKSLFAFLVVAVGEEVLFRGIVFRMIDQRWGTAAALIVSALIFGFVHIINDNATVWSSVAIAVEAGLLLGAAYKWAGNLWLPIGIHWAWNFFQGPIFGFAVSGNGTQSLIKPVIEGSNLLTGGTFGAEASIPAFVLGLAFAVLFLMAKKRRA